MRAPSSQHIDTRPSGTNFLRVIVLADEGWLFINGAYVSELDLSGWSVPGWIGAAPNSFYGDGVAGKTTELSEFVVWSVGTE